MAAPQSKNLSSCSPVPMKPNPRNSEIINPIRRSFSGNHFAKPSIIANQKPGFNPNTPANSPSDYPRRSSISRDNIVVSLRDPEDKENNKDQNSKTVRVRSPASAKGTKNFMSPTISAASKISASPRKKILTERNEPARTSVSFSDGKSPLKEDLDLKPERGLNQKKEVSFDPTITYLEDNEALNDNEDIDSVENSNSTDGYDSFSGSLAVENDFVNLDPSFKISPRTSCSLPSPALAPLDADPLMPPYDPKTNYLSPRPQFLHYKPNPRIKLYRDGKQLEESFASESSSDTEVTEEETVSDESYSVSQKESKEAASGDLVKEETKEEEEEEEKELLVSEPNPINTVDGAVAARRRPHFLARTKFTALLFVLAIAGLWASVSDSPVMDPSVLNNLNFPSLYVPPEILEFTRGNLEGLAQKFQRWFYSSLSFVHNLIFSFIERHKPGPLQFANLTILLEDSSVDNSFVVDLINFGAEVKYERKVEVDIQSLEDEEADETNEQIAEIQSLQEEDIEPVEGDENIEEDFEGDNNVADVNTEEVADNKEQEFEDQEKVILAPDNFEVSVVHSVPEYQETEPSNSATESSNSDSNIAVVRTDEVAENKVQEFKDQEVISAPDNFEVSAVPESWKIEPSSSATELIQEIADPTELESKTDVIEQLVPILKADEIKNLLTVQASVGISLIVLSLLAVVPFFYLRNRTSTAPNAAIKVDQVPITEKVVQNPLSAATPEITIHERSHWQMEVETLGESCPSEMSSYQYSSSYSKQKMKGTSEAQSYDRRPKSNHRRESLASSDCSMDSASYGSFTTYEKIQIKHGNGDEEFLTPVRRSSRIRSQVTSP